MNHLASAPANRVRRTSLSESLPLTTAKRFLLSGGVSLSLLLICIWPALYNRQPFFYADTSSYIRGADAGFYRLAHRPTVWSGQDVSQDDGRRAAENAGIPRRKSLNSVSEKAVLAGRSIYYGGLLYLGDLTTRLWLVVFVQAATVLLAIALTLNTLNSFTWLRFFFISLLLAALTPMAFFASYLMPDVFAAITVLAVANLLLGVARKPDWAILAWISLLTSALLFHDSHVLIALAMLIVVAFWAALRRRPIPWIGVSGILIALSIALAGQALFNLGVTRLVGAPPLRPPFLMARIIADGPGYRYLVANCPRSPWTVCQFLDRLRGIDSEDFLWDTEPDKGVFAIAGPETRRKLSAEQLLFLRATLAYDPFGVMSAAFRNTWRQLWQFDLDEFNYTADQRDFLTAHIPEPYLGRMISTPAWHQAVPARAFSWVTAVVTIFSIFYLAAFVVRRKASGCSRRSMMFAALVVAGIVMNAAVCGALSRPLNRYQARVIWLLPFAALLLRPRSTQPRPICQEKENRRSRLLIPPKRKMLG